jgi:hypothetical protein
MKKSPWIVFCAAVIFAGLSGQMTAFGASTNAVYSLTSESLFKVGKLKVDKSNSATAVFLSDGTCSLNVGTNVFSGTYAVAKNGKQATLTPDANGLAAIKSNVVDLIIGQVPVGVTISVKSVKFSKIILKKGALFAMDTVSGKGCEGKKCRGFSLKTLWTGWTLVSGTNIL